MFPRRRFYSHFKKGFWLSRGPSSINKQPLPLNINVSLINIGLKKLRTACKLKIHQKFVSGDIHVFRNLCCYLLSSELDGFIKKDAKRISIALLKPTIPSFVLIDGDTAVVSRILQGMFKEINSKAQ